MKRVKSFYRAHAKIIACVLLLGSFSILAQTLQPAAKPKAQVLAGRINISNVTVSQSPGPAVTASETGPQSGGPTPGPLSANERAAVAAQMKSLTAPNPSSLVSTANIPPAPPSQFTLTANQPKSSNSWMSVLLGFSFPGGSAAIASPHVTVGPASPNSRLILHFNPLSRNKTYMLDCAVAIRKKNGTVTQESAAWKFEGDIAGNITPQSGHLIAGFVSAGTTAEVQLKAPSGIIWGYVYSCELTKVN